jgi:hypothetical protein
MLIYYLLSWFLLALVAIANGIVREVTYGKYLSELKAHQLSTVTGILFVGLSVWVLNWLWPIESLEQAWIIGIAWLGATIVFEFGFGHFVAGHPWDKLLADYNLFKGRLWPLFLIWVAVVPCVFYLFGQTSQ